MHLVYGYTALLALSATAASMPATSPVTTARSLLEKRDDRVEGLFCGYYKGAKPSAHKIFLDEEKVQLDSFDSPDMHFVPLEGRETCTPVAHPYTIDSDGGNTCHWICSDTENKVPFAEAYYYFDIAGESCRLDSMDEYPDDSDELERARFSAQMWIKGKDDDDDDYNDYNLVIGGCEVGDDGLKDPSDYSRGNKGERFQCGHSEAPEGHETCPIRAPARDDHAFKP